MRQMKTAAVCGLAAVLAVSAFGRAAKPTPATTGTLTGIVRGQDGKPVEKATVKLTELKNFRPDKPNKATADEPKAEKGKKKAKALTATTDEKGHFKIDDVPPGQYSVTGTLTGVSRGKSNVLVKVGETTDVSISMRASS